MDLEKESIMRPCLKDSKKPIVEAHLWLHEWGRS
jgi:hypothetical protein